MTLLEHAMDCVLRGWHVFPCRPKSKEPAVAGGFKAASNDTELISHWWARWPNANIGIATGASGLCVLDIDKGFRSTQDFYAWYGANPGYAVRTGRTDGVGIQVYYKGSGIRSIPWSADGLSGDLRCETGYVMAAGSIHPSGNAYVAILDDAIPPFPQWVLALKSIRVDARADEPIASNRNTALTSIAGKLRNAGLSAAALEVGLLQVNADRCVPPLDDAEVRRIAQNASRWELPTQSPTATIGTPGRAVSGPVVTPSDPGGSALAERTAPAFMTLDEFDNVPAPEFLIQGFLTKGAISMLAGPVAQRKTLVAMNVVHALCTGEKLFGEFDVLEKPRAVFYLCPEMGAAEFVARLKNAGLRDYIGDTLFCLTMSQSPIRLDDLETVGLENSVVVVDTLTRYVDGNENDSSDMRLFAGKIMSMVRMGATVVLLHHSKKGSSGTLDDGLRGSSELAAFVTSCWVTGLKDLQRPYDSQSTMRNVKQRDFQSEPFLLDPTPDSVMLRFAGKDEPKAEIQKAKDADLDSAVAALLCRNPETSVEAARQVLSQAGVKRGTKAVKNALARVRALENSTGVVAFSDIVDF